ncbi:hypothetical protein C477_09916 [Haloterrigena salina JCM 13891]|uniref:DUF7575 domain-containing protein n=1 Tax=Haloterrigena salina JCM 13891 TaxID=1227488 RepID=M0C9M5_9EURY|nr:hypothetical protein [Haloterrigena salina]ELZ18614.1 hypothetical protein C477_09916 [Haloterrigena salina JCM 13891]
MSTYGVPDEVDVIACHHCGESFNPDLEFCHWCTRPVVDGGVTASRTDDWSRPFEIEYVNSISQYVVY